MGRSRCALLAGMLLLPLAGLARGARQARQPLDEGYTRKIREYTTEKFFLTELVDHLPASETVPTPEKVLGYVAGAPDRLTYSKDLYRYYAALEKASPRVRVFNLGKSEEGRDTLLVAVSDEANLANLDRLKAIAARLADPRTVKDDAEADRLIAEGKPIYWASGSIHSPEAGSPEMLMELAYRLAVEDSPAIQRIRRDSVVLITPVLEVDGHDRYVDTYVYRKKYPDRTPPGLLYWGRYVAHDNNRDQLGLSLALSRNITAGYLDWHPTVLHDLHESVPFLYTSTGTGPYNAWLDPIVIDEFHLLAYHEIEEMTKRGVPGVWTHGFYDGWAPNYMLYAATGHNSIGRFYETFGGRGADTGVRSVGAAAQRAWFRPNPPLERVNWSIRNNVNMQQSALLLAMQFVAEHRERFLRNFYLKSRRSVEKAKNEGPAAWVIPADDPRPGACADLVNLLQRQGVEVHVAEQEFEVKLPGSGSRAQGAGGASGRAGAGAAAAGEASDSVPPTPNAQAPTPPTRFPRGSYVMGMDQPYSRWADMVLDTQYFNVDDPAPYDDTGWTLGPLRNVRTVRVTDTDLLAVPMTRLRGPVTPEGRLLGPEPAAAYVLNHNADNALATLRFRLKDLKVWAAEKPFSAGGQAFNAGSFIVKAEEGPKELREQLAQQARELGLTVRALEVVPSVPTHPVAVPRIAILHTWQNTQNEGWCRLAFESVQVPYSYISDHTIRDTPDLKAKFDVIVFPAVGGSAQSIVRGLPMRGGPIPWQASELTPNIGMSPDTTADMRGGMGLAGILNLQRFLEAGGVFVPVTTNASIPIDFGLTEGVAVQPAQQLQARGSIYNGRVADAGSPIAYGYGEALALYFNQAPLLQVAAGGGAGRGEAPSAAGTGAGRPSGRGSPTDPDVPQGRPRFTPPPAAADGDTPAETRRLQPSAAERPRVVLRFAPERELLVSGMLAGGAELAGRPAVVDAPVGKGHVVFFATNPMWRMETQGEFFLIFNTCLHFDHLGAGRATARDARSGR